MECVSSKLVNKETQLHEPRVPIISSIYGTPVLDKEKE